MTPFKVERLNAAHDRNAFDCGVEPLNRYLKQSASQDERRNVAACFVATDAGGSIAGFYTLASASVWLDALPSATQKKLPRYPTVPAVRLGRLAVSALHRGRGLGGALLVDALTRASASEVAAYAMVVDAKDEEAARFYEHFGFMRIGESLVSPPPLFLPLETFKRIGQSRNQR